jgi:hypothetical protein
MSLDIPLKEVKVVEVYDSNITHNLGPMAGAAGIYGPLWHPERNGILYAKDLMPHLQNGIKAMEAEPNKFIVLEPSNRWGTYEGFLRFLKGLLDACRENPDAVISVSR